MPSESGERLAQARIGSHADEHQRQARHLDQFQPRRIDAGGRLPDLQRQRDHADAIQQLPQQPDRRERPQRPRAFEHHAGRQVWPTAAPLNDAAERSANASISKPPPANASEAACNDKSNPQINRPVIDERRASARAD